MGHVELFKQKVVLSLQEGGERVPMLEVHADGREVLVEAPNDVVDERMIGDDLDQVIQGIGHGLELAAIVGDREIALHKIPKGGVEVESMLFEELVFQKKLDKAGGGGILLDDLLKVGGTVP
jgi:hypothetical protein